MGMGVKAKMKAQNLWATLGTSGWGRWLFAKAVCWNAPYFSSIAPRVLHLAHGVCEAQMHQRRAVQNHLGTVHAIAVCNLVELCAGLVTDVSVPAGMRWIPRGMNVQYVQKAKGRLTACAQLAEPDLWVTAGTAFSGWIDVRVCDADQQLVASAQVEMWLSPLRLSS